MKIARFIYEIFKKFPTLLIGNIILLLGVSFFSACSMFTISPVVDFLIHPDLKGISPLTEKAVDIVRFLGLPVRFESWLFILVIFVALSSAFQVFANASVMKTRFTVAWDIMHDTFMDFFNTKWQFFTGSSQGMILNTFSREVIYVGDAFGAMVSFFANILQIAFFLAVPFYISWQVTAISLSVAILFVIPFTLLGKFSYRLGVRSTDASNKLISVVNESISLSKIILGFGRQKKSIDNLESAFRMYRRSTILSQTMNSAIPLTYRPFSIIMISVALFVSRGYGVPLSETLVLLLSLQQVGSYVGILAMQKNSLENFFPSYEQIESLRKRARQLRQKEGGLEFRGFNGELTIEGLSFAYPGHDPILSGVNARIPEGKMIAFVGESGAGKSTLIDLIMGFHEPTEGRIAFDGRSLGEYEIQSYRHRVGYVPQDSVLFNMSIRDNFLWAVESATDEDIAEACRRANADEFIKKLPDGYRTVVGDRGVRLSGGQVQRIALARAILLKPDLLILDEATSSLDTNSERLIQGAVEKIVKETTVIVIAHRLSTIVNADYIYVLHRGCVVEEGTYPELMRMGNYFNRMANLQVL